MTNHMTRKGLIRGVVVGMATIMLVVLAGCGGGGDKVLPIGGGINHWVVLTSRVGYTYNMNDPLTGSGGVTFNAKYGDPATKILAMRKYHPSDGVSMASPVPVFSQVDPLWSGDLLGTDTDSVNDTIGKLGCAMTCVAMLLKGYGADVTPGTLNRWLTEKEPIGYSNGDLIIWGATDIYPGNVMTYVDEGGAAADLGQINAELDSGRPVVVGL